MILDTRQMQLMAVVVQLLFVLTSAQMVVIILEDDTITEGMHVEVCVELFHQDMISGSASVTLITNDLQADMNVNANSDYIPLREEFMFRAVGPSNHCVTLQTLRDNAIEDTEALNILLVNNSGIEVGPSQHLNILPANDRIVVEFVDRSYTVKESDAILDLYVELIAGSIERQFPSTVEVDFTTTDITAVGSEDYVQPVSISFSAGSSAGSVQRVQLGVREDERVEGAELFRVAIVTSSTEPVTTNSGVTIVTVLDNDVASVDLLSPSTSLLEGDSGERVSVRVCVQLLTDSTFPLDRTVVVIMDAEDVTTDSLDYHLQESLLTFQTGSTSTTTQCTEVDIVGDAQEEVDEEVMVRVFPVSPDITLGGVKKNLTITIRNDDVNCNALPKPPFPVTLQTRGGLIEGATGTYSCDTGYRLMGEAVRLCVKGIWIGVEPTCTVIDCGDPPLLENGNSILGNTTVNNTVVYFCEEGYRQRDNTAQNEIQCHSDGTWSQLDVECISESSTSESDSLGAGGIAAIVIVSLLIVAVAVLGVSLVGGWYLCMSKTRTKRSGKYVVDNTDMDEPKAMNNSIALPTIKSENTYSNLALEDDYTDRTISSPTDV